ncbi:hypothetical protein CYY_006939 [Polysphondylium violaceum]|uniref:U3 small nucleolar ribonucleoprotein protein MPP10 n=1 Tax=Polysphondylium violaceum TaxID=133409 RepID=A0A8J4PQA6_9MYCE|nr:hypothetical protein CYY_006939 [Polysphondylium violaceum]
MVATLTKKKSNSNNSNKSNSNDGSDKTQLDKVDKVMSGIYDTPEVFVGSSEKVKNDMTKLVSDLYQVAKKNTDTNGVETDALDQLAIKGFDNEQIWSQIQLYNDPILRHLDSQINELSLEKDLNLTTGTTKKRSIEYDNSDDNEEEDQEDQDQEDGDDDDDDLDGSIEDDEDLDGSLEDDEDIDEGTFDDDYQEDDDDFEEEEEEEEDDEEDEKVNKKQTKKTPTTGKSKENMDFFDAKEMEKFLDDADDEEYQLREEQEDDEHDFELGDSDEEDGGLVFPEGKFDKQEQELDKLLDKIMEKEGIKVEKSKSKNVDPSKMKFDDFFSNPDEEDEEEDEFGFDHDDYDEDEDNQDFDGEEDQDGDDDEQEQEEEEQEQEQEEINEEPTLSPEEMTAFQKRASRIQDKIRELETQNLKKKDWTMVGEASSKDRPDGSLLNEHLDYEHTQRAAPLVTEQTNRSLEDIIKKRITEKNFDDVIRKTEKEFKDNYKKKVELNDEKSAEGLASVYEKEYMKQVMGVEETDELKAKHIKIYEYYNKLCYKLDSLTNFQHTPKRIKNKELNITTASALNMEDKVPVAASTATMIAPEEVYFKKHADEKGDSELTSEERKKNRKSIKSQWRSEKDEKEASDRIKEKTDPNFVKKNSTAKALAQLKQSRNTTIVTSTDNKTSKYTKSGDFFSKLQTEQENKKKGIEDPSSVKSKKKAKLDQLQSQNFKL